MAEFTIEQQEQAQHAAAGTQQVQRAAEVKEGANMSTRQKGVVKWFNATKGFGFITPSGPEYADASQGDVSHQDQHDVFVHQSSIEAEGFRSLREGEEVEYDVEDSGNGRIKAIHVTGPGGAAPLGALRRAGRGRSSTSVGSSSEPGAGRGFHSGGRGRGQGSMPAGHFYHPHAGYGQYAPGAFYPWPGAYFAPPQMGGMYVGPMRPRRGGRPGSSSGRGGRGEAAQSSGLQVVVHNLPWSCTWQQLKDSFREWRVERADIVTDDLGRSRGFGTIRFFSHQDAAAAIAKYNDSDFEGRTITVRLDKYA